MPDPRPAIGNAGGAEAVLLNALPYALLVINAEDTIRTAYKSGIRVTRPGSDKPSGLPIEISIIDNGPGIAPDIQARLFEPFASTKPTSSGGSGLGLALAAKIIADHGGLIKCQSAPRHTRFTLRLPVYQTPGGVQGDPL